MRDLLRAEAGRGRAVLVSSHLLSEVAQSVDDVVVIAAGGRRAAGSLASVLGSSDGPATRVRSGEPERIETALRERGLGFEPAEGGGLLVRSAPDCVGSVAAQHGIPLNELSAVSQIAGGCLPRPHRGREMSALLHAELLKLRTTRTFAALAAVAVVTSMLLVALYEPDRGTHRGLGARGGLQLRHSRASSSLSSRSSVSPASGVTARSPARCSRRRIVSGSSRPRRLPSRRPGPHSPWRSPFAVAILGYAIVSWRDLPVPEARRALSHCSAGTRSRRRSSGSLGVGIGGVVRNQPTAIVGVLLLSFAVEPVVISVLPEVAPFGPFIGLPLGVQDISASDIGFSELDVLSTRTGRTRDAGLDRRLLRRRRGATSESGCRVAASHSSPEQGENGHAESGDGNDDHPERAAR